MQNMSKEVLVKNMSFGVSTTKFNIYIYTPF